MRSQGEGWSQVEALLVAGLHVTHGTTQAVVATTAGARQSQIPKPLKIPTPNRPKHEPFTRHDWRRALQPPRR